MLGLGLGFSSSSVQGGNASVPFVTLNNRALLYEPNNGILDNGSTSVNTYLDSNQVVQKTSAGDVRVDYTGGTAHILHEDIITNWLRWNRSLTHSDWSKNNMSAAKTATGADGVTNSATTITADAANATILQTLTRTSSIRISSAFVKRRAGSGTIEMTQNGGTLWTAVTVTGSWTKVSIPSATLANPSIGFRIVTSGDEIDIDYVQHEETAFVTSSVETTGSAVSTDLDNIRFPLVNNTNWYQDYGIVLMRYKPQHDSTNTVDGLLGVSNTNFSLFGYTGTLDQFKTFDGTTDATVTKSFSSGDDIYLALMYTGSTYKMSISVNGGAFTHGSQAVYNGSFILGSYHNLFYSNQYQNFFELMKIFRNGLASFSLAQMQTWVDENGLTLMNNNTI